MVSAPDNIPAMRRRPRRSRVAIIGLAILLATLIAVPAAAPIIGGCAVLLLLWGLWGRSITGGGTRRSDFQREPVLWDDGFGAN